MKNRNDFVSNSSSSSFIMPENEKDVFYSHLGHSYKLFKLKTIRDELVKLKEKIKLARVEFAVQTGLDEDSFRTIFEATFNGMYSINECIDENIEEIDDALKEYDNKDCFISEPIDRDRAYEMNYNGYLFKGDL